MSKVLSICIPVFNKSNFTRSCLNDLKHLPDDHEIIIVDNGSTDQTQQEVLQMGELPELKSKLIYHHNDENLGFAKACNIAFGLSTAPNILFLNNDIRVKSNHSDWTQALIEKCPEGLVGPTMGQLDDQFNFVQEANRELSGNSYMSGWCLASSRENWMKLNIPRSDGSDNPQIFSEEFFCYFEDSDVGLRSRQLGIKMIVVDVPVVHFGRQSSQQLNTHKLYTDSRKIFVRKWSKSAR